MAEGFLAAYLVVGSDELKAKEVVNRLKRRLEPGLEEFNLDEVVAHAELGPEGLLSSLNTLPFGAGFRLVLIHDAEKLPKEASEALITYLNDPNPSTVLCLVSQKLAKTTRLYKAVAKVGPRAIIDCAPASRRELPQRVVRMAEVQGMRMDQQTATQLIALVGESTTMLNTQVVTLAELCRQAGVITTKDLDRYVTRIAEVKPWELLDALSARDARKTLTLYEMMRDPSEIALVSMIAGRLRELICVRSLVARGQATMAAQSLGKQEWQLRNHRKWAQGFKAGELSHALVSCAESDKSLKSGGDPRTVFVTLVLGICGAGPLPARSA